MDSGHPFAQTPRNPRVLQAHLFPRPNTPSPTLQKHSRSRFVSPKSRPWSHGWKTWRTTRKVWASTPLPLPPTSTAAPAPARRPLGRRLPLAVSPPPPPSLTLPPVTPAGTASAEPDPNLPPARSPSPTSDSSSASAAVTSALSTSSSLRLPKAAPSPPKSWTRKNSPAGTKRDEPGLSVKFSKC